MRKFGVVFLVIILLSGCSAQSVSTDSSANSKEISVYKRGYSEQEANMVPRIMFLQGDANLKAFPYVDADSINSIKDTYVIIHTLVLNEEQEEWALIEFTDVVNMTNYGYVKLNKLSEKPYTTKYICKTEAISGVAIGDIVEKAIVEFGEKYEVYKSELGWSYAFQRSNGYISVHFDPISNTIEEINLTVGGYKTKEGYQVGDNAIKVLNFYKSKYEMNTDSHLFNSRPESIFHLGDGYVLEFDYEPKELTEKSIITNMRYYNIYNGDW